MLRTSNRTLALAAAGALALGLASCASEDGEADQDSGTETVGSEDGNAEDDTDEQDTDDTADTEDEENGTEDADDTDDAEEPSDEVPAIGVPEAGDSLAVFGVEHDDVLWVRESADPSDTEVVELGPLETDVIATGETQETADGTWYEVEAGGSTGWAHGSYLYGQGLEEDAAQEFATEMQPQEYMDVSLDILSNSYPEADLVVAQDDEAGTFTVDVVGLPDDSIFGLRYHFVYDGVGDTDEPLTINEITKTTMCLRGVSDSGLCT